MAFLMMLSPIRVTTRIAADGVAKVTRLFLDRTGPEGRAAELLAEFLSTSHTNLEADFEALCAANLAEGSE